MELETLEQRVRSFFTARAGDYGLDRGAVEARYVLNWGGFVNPSFTVSDGVRAYHLKLAEGPEGREALRQQYALRELLSARYHAPRALDWIEIPAYGHAGLLYERIKGRHPDLAREPQLVSELLAVLRRLHADTELAARLSPAPERRCVHTFVGTYIERFDEDLDTVEPALPEFVAPETLAWMRAETRQLEAAARDSAAFAAPARAPIHGDIWSDNILVTERGAWYLLDWDSLARGDAALDWAMVLAPEVHFQDYTWWRDNLPADAGESFEVRVELYLRAWLLDWVVDVLADYVEADRAPEHAEQVRERKRAEHLRHLSLYRVRYG